MWGVRDIFFPIEGFCNKYLTSTMCNCGAEKEDNEHYLLHCPIFDLTRADLFGQLSEIPALDIYGMNSKILCSLLLYGCSQLDNVTNRMILDSTVSYIKKTKRFQ